MPNMNVSHLVKDQVLFSKFWGVAKITYTHTAVYFNLGTFLMMTATFWFTTGNKWSVKYLGFSITYPGFMLILAIGALVAMWVIYKFEMPSSFRFWFDQGYQHSTLLPGDLKRMESKLDIIENGLVKRHRLHAKRLLKRRLRHVR